MIQQNMLQYFIIILNKLKTREFYLKKNLKPTLKNEQQFKTS